MSRTINIRPTSFLDRHKYFISNCSFLKASWQYSTFIEFERFMNYLHPMCCIDIRNFWVRILYEFFFFSISLDFYILLWKKTCRWNSVFSLYFPVFQPTYLPKHLCLLKLLFLEMISFVEVRKGTTNYLALNSFWLHMSIWTLFSQLNEQHQFNKLEQTKLFEQNWQKSKLHQMWRISNDLELCIDFCGYNL